MENLPVFHQAANTPFDRRKFLDGTYHCYYGPSQSPSRASYRKPLDWPKAGSLLAVPQVVWLSGFFDSHFFDPEDRGAFFTVFSATMKLPGADPDTGVYYLPNADQASYVAAQEMFLAVKDAIEAIRPNRTWVHPVDWSCFQASPDPNNPFVPFGGITGDYTDRYVGGNTFVHLRCLPAADTTYYGTDFLHIYGGRWAIDSSGSRLTTSIESLSPPTSHSAYVNDKADIIAAARRFSRFALHCYGYSQTWQAIPNVVPGDAYSGSPLDDAAIAEMNAIIDSINAAGAGPDPAYINYSNGGPGPDATNAVIQATCDDLAGSLSDTNADISYEGSWNSQTVQSLVESIARHFGFDPVTGDDLPIGD